LDERDYVFDFMLFLLQQDLSQSERLCPIRREEKKERQRRMNENEGMERGLIGVNN
jgi:DNA polymerase III delta prime subunit